MIDSGLTTLEDLQRYQYKTILLQRIGAISWSREAIDLRKQYVSEFESREGGTIMPPSPGVRSYQLKYLMGPDYTEFSVDFNFRSGFKKLLSIIEKEQPEQILHRSRQFTMAVSRYRAHEIKKRLETIENFGKDVESKQMPEALAHESFEIIFGNLKKYMALDENWIHKYIHEHKKSSTGEGLKWDALNSLVLEDWNEIFSAVQNVIDATYENEGHYLKLKFYTGLRARSPPLDDVKEHQDGKVDRTRIITFHPSMSLWSLFIPDKKRWYKETMKDLTNLFGLDSKAIHLPMVEGGQVYLKAAELLEEGLNYYAYDGKSWDAMVGLIGGKTWYSMLTPISVPMLPTGITATSLMDTLISMYYYSRYMQGEEVVILGDDINVFAKTKPYAGDRIMEFQEKDTKYRFLLGVSYYRDVRLPRLQGIKLTTDRGEKALPLPESSDDWNIMNVQGHHPTSTQGLWYGLHFGYFGSRSLLDAIAKIPSEEYKGPTEMIHQLADIEDEQVRSEALNWVEEATELERYELDAFKEIE